MTLRAGLLNRLVRFERRTRTTNEFNEQAGDWREFAQTRAQIVSISAREFFAAMQAQSDATLRVICRYSGHLATVRPTDRIREGERTLDIQAVIDPTGRRRELHFLVVERSDSA